MPASSRVPVTRLTNLVVAGSSRGRRAVQLVMARSRWRRDGGHVHAVGCSHGTGRAPKSGTAGRQPTRSAVPGGRSSTPARSRAAATGRQGAALDQLEAHVGVAVVEAGAPETPVITGKTTSRNRSTSPAAAVTDSSRSPPTARSGRCRHASSRVRPATASPPTREPGQASGSVRDDEKTTFGMASRPVRPSASSGRKSPSPLGRGGRDPRHQPVGGGPHQVRGRRARARLQRGEVPGPSRPHRPRPALRRGVASGR